MVVLTFGLTPGKIADVKRKQGEGGRADRTRRRFPPPPRRGAGGSGGRGGEANGRERTGRRTSEEGRRPPTPARRRRRPPDRKGKLTETPDPGEDARPAARQPKRPKNAQK